MTRAGLLLGMLALGLPPASAQTPPAFEVHPDYTVRQWTIQDGLPANTITHILQSSDGYLWLATNEGATRFDGQCFTTFNTANTPALPYNRVTSLAEGAPGQVWAVTVPDGVGFFKDGQYTLVDPDGRQVLYVEGDTVWTTKIDGVARYAAGRLEAFRPEVLDGTGTAVVRDRHGRLWVGVQEKGIYRFDPDETVRRFGEDDGVPAQPIGRFLVDREGGVWTGVQGGVIRILKDRVSALAHPDGAWPQDTEMEFEDAGGGVWFWSKGEGWWQHDPSGALTLLPGPLSGGRFLQTDADGRQWRVEANRLYRDDALILRAEETIEAFAFDRRGNVWVCATRSGLLRLRRAAVRTISAEEGLPGRNVYPVLEDRHGVLWVGTDLTGLARLEDERVTGVLRPGVSIRSLYEDRAGRLWVSADEVCRVQGNRCLDVDTPAGDIPQFGILSMYEDRQGRFWMGGALGVLRGDPRGDDYAWTVFTGDGDLPYRVRAIIQTRDGTLLFASIRDGVLRYDEDHERFEALTTTHGLASNNVRDLYEDRDGYVWIALEDRGLCRLDRRDQRTLAGGELACLSTAEGLYWHGLHRILEDDYGRFWFNTNNGLFWVERAALMAYFAGEVAVVSSVSYTETDGMRHREGNGARQPAGIKARDGRLWFPTQDGVVVVDPAAIQAPTPPPVVIEALFVEADARAVAGALTLAADERDLEVVYTALEFARPEDVHFQYRLGGYDRTWRRAGTQRQASYTNLPPGSYVFQVRAGIGGRWGEAATLAIERLPYFWQTTWFYVLVAMFFAFVGPSIYVLRVRQLKAREAELEQTVAERTGQLADKAHELERANELKNRFLANISHEFRTPLTLTFGPLDDALHGRFASFHDARPHFERARRNGARLLRLINQLLDLSRLDAGALLLHLQRRDLAPHLRQIAAMFESMAQTKGLALRLNLPDEPVFHVYDADKLEKVVINLLSNAFKFTPRGGKVSLTLDRAEDDVVRITVADTGPGMAAEHLPHLFDRFYQVEGSSTRKHEGSGIGLSLVKELVELHEGEVAVESTVGFGTRLTVLLPVLEAGETAEPEAVPKTELKEPDPVVLDAHVHDIALSAQPPSSARTSGDSLRSSPIPTAAIDEAVVLLIEDNADMRAYIRAHLEASFTIVEAQNGTVGVERAQELVPDLVLSDVMMPEMDGLELCQALKTDTRTSHIPVVLLTAKAAVEHRIAGFESGADAYLPKPFNAEELQVRVRTMIEERRRLRARFAGERGVAGRVLGTEEPGTVAELPPREAAFLEQVEELIGTRLAESQFGVDPLAEAVSMSRRQLHRKLLALTDETPAVLIRRRRLERAAALLGTGLASVKEVTFTVGFANEASFRRAFGQHYGMAPSAYAEQVRQR